MDEQSPTGATFEVRNKKTGQTRQVTADEYRDQNLESQGFEKPKDLNLEEQATSTQTSSQDMKGSADPDTKRASRNE